jgi:hypothetical protein
MPLRSLEYLIKAKKKYWKEYSHLPVLSVVVYLLDEKNLPISQEHWPAPYRRTAMNFYYLTIEMKQLPRAELVALREPALWPLMLLAEGPMDRVLIQEMFTELLELKLRSTLLICHAFAQWVLHGDDLDWFQKEYKKMFEFEVFAKSDLFQFMEQTANERAEQRVNQKYDQKLQEERKIAEKKLQEERKKTLLMFQKAVLGIVAQRFPTLQRLAKTQARRVKEPELFQQVMLDLSMAQNSDEAQDVLFSLTEKEEGENRISNQSEV